MRETHHIYCPSDQLTWNPRATRVLTSALNVLALRSDVQAAGIVARLAITAGGVHTGFVARCRLTRVRGRKAGVTGYCAEGTAVEADAAADRPALSCEEV